MKADVAFAVAELRGLGRKLVEGSWSKHARPMDVPRALAVMASAMSFVVDAGVGSIVERGRQMIAELSSGRMPSERQPLNFDDEDER